MSIRAIWNGFQAERNVFLKTVAVALALQAFLSGLALADPPSAIDRSFTNSDWPPTFNVITNNLVSGGALPRRINSARIISQGDDDGGVSWDSSCLTYSGGFGTVVIGFTVLGADGQISNEGTITIADADTTLNLGPGCLDPQNNAPAVGSAGTISGPSVLDTSPEVLINVLASVSDELLLLNPPRPDLLTVAITSQPSIGSARVVNGSVGYTPAPVSIATTATVGLRVCDPERCGDGTLNITVNSSDQPAAVDDGSNDDRIAVPYNQSLVVDVLANDSPGAEILRVLDVTAGATAEIETVAGRQQIRYTPPPDFVGPDTFRYEITSGATATVFLDIAPGTLEPTPDRATTIPGQTVRIFVLNNDPGGPNALTIVAVTQPSNGSAVIVQNDTAVDYTPGPGFGAGPGCPTPSDDGSECLDVFTYTVSDGNPATPDRSALVTVGVGELPPRLSELGQNPTQRAVGRAVDVVCPRLNAIDNLPEESIELRNRCNWLIGQAEIDPDSVPDALQQIAGEEISSTGTTMVQIANLQTSNIASRIAALRGGARGVSLGGVALSIEGKQVPGQVMSALAPGGGGASGDDSNPWSRMGMFVNGRWNFGDKDETDLESAYDFDTYGLTGGIDYRFTDSLIMGVALGYSETEVKFGRDVGEIDGDAWNLTAYGTWYRDNFYVDFSAGYGDVNFDATRTLKFPDAGPPGQGNVDSQTKGSTSGDQTSFYLSTGYNFSSGPWLIGPYLSWDYLKADIDGFAETGGDGWALRYHDQTVKSVIATGGARVSYTISTSWGVLIPHARADFKREFEDEARVIRAQFALDPTNYVMEFATDEPDKDFYTWAIGFSFVTKNGLSGFVDYESLAGYDNLTSNTLTAGIRFQRAFR